MWKNRLEPHLPAWVRNYRGWGLKSRRNSWSLKRVTERRWSASGLTTSSRPRRQRSDTSPNSWCYSSNCRTSQALTGPTPGDEYQFLRFALMQLCWSDVFRPLQNNHKLIIFLHTYIFKEHFSVDSIILQMFSWCNLPYSLICCWKKAHTRHNLLSIKTGSLHPVQHIGKKTVSLTTANKRKKITVLFDVSYMLSDIIKCLISLHILLLIFDENTKGN